MIAKAKFTKRELQSLAGKLNFAVRVVYGGQTFLRRIIDAINTLQHPYHRMRMNTSLRKDFLWWINFMEHFNGTTFFTASEPMTPMEFSTDACPVGGGGHFGDDWFYVNWKLDYPEFPSSHINELEIFTVLLGLRRWRTGLSMRRWIVNYTDNNVMKLWLNKGTSRFPQVMASLREIFWLSAVNNSHLMSRYIPSKANVVADTLSHLHNCLYADHFLSLLNNNVLAVIQMG